MRTKETIENDLQDVDYLILEILLDIRELIEKILPNKSLNSDSVNAAG